MDPEIRSIFNKIEAHSMSLIGAESAHGMSSEENRILALQDVNRLNQRIGLLVRSGKESLTEMKLLQTHVNRLTIGLKNNNVSQIKGALASIRGLIETLERLGSLG